MRTLRNPAVVFFLLLLASLAFLLPLFLYPEIHFGQLGKQTFAAQMIESTARGELRHGVFPIRHFLENYHEDLIPWAEEVPLYSFIAAGLVKFFGIPVILAGKILSMLAFFFIIWGFARIGDAVRRPKWIFAMVAASYPVFRLYSVQVMPDPWMTACLVWAIDSCLRKKVLRTALFIFLASIFKYYAVFLGAGIGLYWLTQKKYRDALLLGLAVVPCFLYVAWFIHLGIPNPIIDSRVIDGHGHLSSFENVLSLKNWMRVILWWFVKNSSIPGSLLAIYGSFFVFSKKSEWRLLALCLLGGSILFPLFFISSFYVHDYYGLQGSIGIALLAAFGVCELFKRHRKMASLMLMLLLGFSLVTVTGMAKIMTDYDTVETAVRAQNLSPDWVLSISGISKPVLSYHLGLNAYIVGVDEWGREPVKARIRDPRLKYALIHEFKDYHGSLVQIQNDLREVGFKTELLSLSMKDTEFKLLSK